METLSTCVLLPMLCHVLWVVLRHQMCILPSVATKDVHFSINFLVVALVAQRRCNHSRACDLAALGHTANGVNELATFIACTPEKVDRRGTMVPTGPAHPAPAVMAAPLGVFVTRCCYGLRCEGVEIPDKVRASPSVMTVFAIVIGLYQVAFPIR